MARHLCESYGDRASDVMKYAQPTGERWPVLGRKLHPLYPYLLEEIDYAVHHEYACTAMVRNAPFIYFFFLSILFLFLVFVFFGYNFPPSIRTF